MNKAERELIKFRSRRIVRHDAGNTMTLLHEIEWEAPLIEPYRNPDAEALERIVRIRRRLGLPTPEPPARRWYRVQGEIGSSWASHQVRLALERAACPPLAARRPLGAPVLRRRELLPCAAAD